MYVMLCVLVCEASKDILSAYSIVCVCNIGHTYTVCVLSTYMYMYYTYCVSV